MNTPWRFLVMGSALLVINQSRPAFAESPPDTGSTDQGTVFLVTGDRGTTLVSPDGRRWTPGTEALTAVGNWRGMAEGRGTFVAVGCDGRLRCSTNGTAWTVVHTGTPSALHDVAYGHGRFVAVGNEGALVTSADGMKWNVGNSGTDERLRGITFAQERFIAVGHAGTILTSRNGNRWTRHNSETELRLQDVAYGEGTFVAVGWGGLILASSDASKWTRCASGTPEHLRQVTLSTVQRQSQR